MKEEMSELVSEYGKYINKYLLYTNMYIHTNKLTIVAVYLFKCIYI